MNDAEREGWREGGREGWREGGREGGGREKRIGRGKDDGGFKGRGVKERRGCRGIGMGRE